MSYNTFAKFYDKLTENVEYKKRADYISSFFRRYADKCDTVLDLACGTGSVSKYLSDLGYNVIGLDLSDEMLTVASSKQIKNAMFIKGDMTDFELPHKVDCCVCSLDSINHLKDIVEVKKCFDCVYNSLNDGGVFVFDVNTVYKHKNVLGNNTFVFDEEDFFLSWDNEYLGDNTVRILLDFFVYNGKNYDRFSEEFNEKAYSVNELKSVLNNFNIIGIYDELNLDDIKDKWETEGIQMVPISVNFAGETLRQENIADQMSALIEKYQVLCEYLEVEVSESYTDTNQEMLQ